MSRTYDATIPQGIYEINGSRTENYNDNEFTAHIDFICPWNYRNFYANAMMNRVYPQHISVLADGSLDTSFYANYYPAAAISCNVATMGAEGVEVVPGVGVEEVHYQAYTAAKVSVDYKAISRPGNWSIQESVTPNYSMRQLPSWGYYWRSDGSPILDNESPAVQEIRVSINRTLTGVRNIPWWFYGLGGKVNINPWADSLTGDVYLPGTLLFVPSNLQRSVTYKRDDDDNIWTVGFTLNWNPIGWNSFRRPHGVDMMMRQANPVYFYPLARFPNLLISREDVLAGDDYIVLIEYTDGTTGQINVDSWGNVTAVGS